MLDGNDYMAQPAIPGDVRLPYGDHPDQFGDLYLPAGAGPHPTVVLIHGGCWQQQYPLGPLGEPAAALAGAGYAVWNIEYRRIGGDGGWPTTMLDVALAIDALRAVAVQFRLDLTRLVTVGHSAGGHLALWLAGRGRISADSELFSDNPLLPQGVVALAALADLAEGRRRQLCGDACSVIGGGVAAHDAALSPAELLPLGVRQIHLAGSDDPIVPLDYLQQFCDRAVAAGDRCRLEVFDGYGHFELTSIHSRAFPVLLTALAELTGQK
jgi:acetyl esterase/lipase